MQGFYFAESKRDLVVKNRQSKATAGKVKLLQTLSFEPELNGKHVSCLNN